MRVAARRVALRAVVCEAGRRRREGRSMEVGGEVRRVRVRG